MISATVPLNKSPQMPLALDQSRLRVDSSQKFLVPSLPVSSRALPPGQQQHAHHHPQPQSLQQHYPDPNKRRPQPIHPISPENGRMLNGLHHQHHQQHAPQRRSSSPLGVKQGYSPRKDAHSPMYAGEVPAWQGRSSLPIPCSSPSPGSSASPKGHAPHNELSQLAVAAAAAAAAAQGNRLYPGAFPPPTAAAAAHHAAFYAAAAAAAGHSLPYPSLFGGGSAGGAAAYAQHPNSYLDFHSKLLRGGQGGGGSPSNSPPSRGSYPHAASPQQHQHQGTPPSILQPLGSPQSTSVTSLHTKLIESVSADRERYHPQHHHHHHHHHPQHMSSHAHNSQQGRGYPQQQQQQGSHSPQGLSKGGPLGISGGIMGLSISPNSNSPHKGHSVATSATPEGHPKKMYMEHPGLPSQERKLLAEMELMNGTSKATKEALLLAAKSRILTRSPEEFRTHHHPQEPCSPTRKQISFAPEPSHRYMNGHTHHLQQQHHQGRSAPPPPPQSQHHFLPPSPKKRGAPWNFAVPVAPVEVEGPLGSPKYLSKPSNISHGNAPEDHAINSLLKNFTQHRHPAYPPPGGEPYTNHAPTRLSSSSSRFQSISAAAPAPSFYNPANSAYLSPGVPQPPPPQPPPPLLVVPNSPHSHSSSSSSHGGSAPTTPKSPAVHFRFFGGKENSNSFPTTPTRGSSGGGVGRGALNARNAPLPVEQMPLITAFRKGSIIRLASGELKTVEDLREEDFEKAVGISDSVKIVHCVVLAISAVPDSALCKVTLAMGHQQQQQQVVVESGPEQPFFVRGRGWSSSSPQLTEKLLQLPCATLAVGDVCITLSRQVVPRVVPPSPGGRGGRPPKQQGPRPYGTYQKNRNGSTGSILKTSQARGTVSVGGRLTQRKPSVTTVTTPTTPTVTVAQPTVVVTEEEKVVEKVEPVKEDDVSGKVGQMPAEATRYKRKSISPVPLGQAEQREVNDEETRPPSPKKRRWSAPEQMDVEHNKSAAAAVSSEKVDSTQALVKEESLSESEKPAEAAQVEKAVVEGESKVEEANSSSAEVDERKA